MTTGPHPEAVRRGLVNEDGSLPTKRSKTLAAARATTDADGLRGNRDEQLRQAAVTHFDGSLDPSKVSNKVTIREGGK